MQTRTATRGREPEPTKKRLAPAKTEPKPCSICSGTLVLDAFGAAVFCDECWSRKCLDMLEG